MTNEELAKLAKLLVKFMKAEMFGHMPRSCGFYLPVCLLMQRAVKLAPVKAEIDASDIPF